MRQVLRFWRYEHARHVLQARHAERTRQERAGSNARFARAGQGTRRAAGAGSHALRRLGKERALHRLLMLLRLFRHDVPLARGMVGGAVIGH